MGLFGPTIYGKGCGSLSNHNVCKRLVCSHHGSLWTHNVWERLVRSQHTMDLFGPTAYRKGLFAHNTPWISLEPQCIEKAGSLTTPHGSLWTQDVCERLVRSQHTTGLFPPTIYVKDWFAHNTPWVSLDPQYTGKAGSLTTHHGCLWTHDVCERLVRSQHTMGLFPPTIYVKDWFAHNTPWVSLDPQYTGKAGSLTTHHGSLFFS